MARKKYTDGTGRYLLKHPLDELLYTYGESQMINGFEVTNVQLGMDVSENNFTSVQPTLNSIVDYFYSKFQTGEAKGNKIFEVDFGGINIYISLLQTPTEILEAYIENVKNKEAYMKRLKSKKKEDMLAWQLHQQQLFFDSLAKRKDPLLGLKLMIAGMDPEALRILNLLGDQLGPEKAEAYLLKMQRNNMTADKIVDAYHQDSGGSITALEQMVETNNSDLYELSEETNKVDTPDVSIKTVTTKETREEEGGDNKTSRKGKPPEAKDKGNSEFGKGIKEGIARGEKIISGENLRKYESVEDTAEVVTPAGGSVKKPVEAEQGM